MSKLPPHRKILKMRAVIYTFLALCVLVIAGCGEKQEETNASPIQEIEAQTQVLGGRNVDFGSDNYNQLWDRATLAFNEGRLWAPSGNNAVEFYLQIKQGVVFDKGNPEQMKAGRALDAALDDFTPILSLSIDEAIEGRKIQEASRLIRMLAAIDSQAPSLVRQIEQVRAIASLNTTE